MKLMFGIQIVRVVLSLEPCQQPPFSRRHSALCTASNRIRALLIPAHAVSRFRSLEGERGIFFVGEHPLVEGTRLRIALSVLAGVDERSIGQANGVDIVASTAKVVICAPGIGGRYDRNLSGLNHRSDYPRE